MTTMVPHSIGRGTKHDEAARHLELARTLEPGTILLYKDGSKLDKGRTSSAWHCVRVTPEGNQGMFEE